MTAASFRDCKEWRAEGLQLSTVSDEACRLYDAIITQTMMWRNDETLGGISGCISRLQAADPAFVMGHVIAVGLELMGSGSSPQRNKRLADMVSKTVKLAETQQLTVREELHVKAVEELSKGCLPRACSLWDDILVEHPTDMLAIKLAQVGLFYLGYQAQMRDILARVLPFWKPHMPLYSHLKGLYAFGLVETNCYDQAEKYATEALALAPDDAWSVHTMAHVHEMRADPHKGIVFMESTESRWKGSDLLASHNYWHWALHHIEKVNLYGLFTSLWDQKCVNSVKGFCGCSSCSGVGVKDRWRELFQVTQTHMEDHVLLFNDLHFLMASLGAGEQTASRRLLETLQDLGQGPGENHTHQLALPIGAPMCQALLEYDGSNYSRAVELLQPIRYHFQQIGGSNAQRDIFNQLLIHAAMKSEKRQHHRLARSADETVYSPSYQPVSCVFTRLCVCRCLLTEREAVRPNCQLTHRLILCANTLPC
ncbi:tetratricopeptide repeat protein 38-like isoform X1 [Arapaima gigas]